MIFNYFYNIIIMAMREAMTRSPEKITTPDTTTWSQKIQTIIVDTIIQYYYS